MKKIPNLTLRFDRRRVATEKRTGTVELEIYFRGVRRYINSGIQLFPHQWKNGAVINREDAMILNRQLQGISKRCSEIIMKMVEEDKIDIRAIPDILDETMVQKQTFLEYAHECAKQKMKTLREGTRKRYKVVFDFLDSWKGIVCFSDVTEKNILKMEECLVERKLMDSTRYDYHKILKVFVRQAFNDGLIKKNPYAKIKIKRGDSKARERCLTPDEFRRFETCEIKSEHLSRVRDLFVFQTYTMMGYSDLERFKMEDCVEVDGQMVYKACRTKTEQPFMFVLLKPALDILKKYDYKLPIISNTKYNDYLKSAVTYAKINKPVCTHWARHTGATMLLNEGGVPMHVLQHILGHASIRETERTYAKVLDKTIVKSMADYQKVFDKK